MAKRLRRERNEQIALAWNTAALFRVKKMPKLDKLIQKEPRTPSQNLRPVTEAEVRAWLSKAPKSRRRSR